MCQAPCHGGCIVLINHHNTPKRWVLFSLLFLCFFHALILSSKNIWSFFKKVLSPENLISGRNNKIKIQYKCNPAQGFQMVLCSTLGAQAAYTSRTYEGDLTVKSATGLAGWMENSKAHSCPFPTYVRSNWDVFSQAAFSFLLSVSKTYTYHIAGLLLWFLHSDGGNRKAEQLVTTLHHNPHPLWLQ